MTGTSFCFYEPEIEGYGLGDQNWIGWHGDGETYSGLFGFYVKHLIRSIRDGGDID